MSESPDPTDPASEPEPVGEFDLTPDGEVPEAPSAEEFEEIAYEAAPAADSEEDDQALKAVSAERDELKDKLMRTAADFQNYVRRANQNLDATKQETLMKVAKALVGVLDNFDRALEVDPETTSAADVQQGVEGVRASLLQALEGFGVQKLTVEPGTAFDPNLHEALMRQPAESVEPDHVAAQFMPGYVLNDQPVRPAQVSVAE